jgi:hypothetical protein
VFDSKEVSSLKGDELIKIHKTVKENANLGVVLLQLIELEMSLLRRLYHVVHLTKQIHEKNGFMVEIF